MKASLKNKFYTTVLVVAALLITQLLHAQPGAVNLRCEHLVSPLGIDAVGPRLSWQMNDQRQGAVQTAFQVLVTKAAGADASREDLVWDSGIIKSSSNLVEYSGPALQPFTRYYWKVRCWDKDGKQMADSETTCFETGMMDQRNWTGNWISDHGDINTLPAPYFRKVFNSAKKIRSARAYIAVAGLYNLFLNGNKVGDHRLDPMYTRFDRRNLYVSYDVTEYLQNGKNAVGVVLGNGWYNHQSMAVWNFDRAPWRQRPAFCLDLRIVYEDGSVQVVATDDSWKTHSGPVVFNSIYTGEHYDSRNEIPGWSIAGFDDSKWQGTMLRSAPSANVVSQAMVPVRNAEKIPAQSVTKFSDTNYVFDLGRNIAGVTAVKLNGDSGTVVRIIHGERLYKESGIKEDGKRTVKGHVDQSNIDVYYRPKDASDPYQTDIVILNGKGPVNFMPEFNYKGFQYVEIVSSKPLSLKKEDLVGYFMHSDVEPAGTISSSNPLIGKLWKATNNSYLSNLFGFPTDCPQREKNGWTGDGHFAVETGLYNFDGISVYEKWMADHRDEQQPNGVLPDIIPTGGWGYGHANGTDWTSTIAVIPWTLYMFYGDTRPLSDNYEHMKTYVNYVERTSKDGLTSFGRGDWVPVKSASSLEYTSSVYFFVDADIVAKAAAILGKKDDSIKYSALAAKIRHAINEKYFNREKASYGSGVQTELSMALQWGIVPGEYSLRVAETLAQRVAADGMHLDVGVLGARAILNALSDNGQAETAYKLAVQDTYPSWGWWIVNGATTLYENWDINASRDISLNHMMFGAIGGWFFSGLGGIKPDERAPGFKSVLLQPNFVSGLDHFSSSHRGPFGTIISNWSRSGKTIIYDVTIPANSSATVKFPAGTGAVYLAGKQVAVTNGYHLPAGTYRFTVKGSKFSN